MSLRFLRISLRFILPLALILGVFALALLPLADELTQRWFLRDLKTRSQLVAAALSEPARPALLSHDTGLVRLLFENAIRDGQVLAFGLCDANGRLLYRSALSVNLLDCQAKTVKSLLITERIIEQDGVMLGKLMLAQDTSFMERRNTEFRHYLISAFVLMFLVISTLSAWITHWSWLS